LSVGADDFFFFVVPRQFSQVVGEWPENQILIPDWTYFHCPGTTLKFDCWLVRTIFIFCCLSSIFTSRWRLGEWPENQILIPDWTYFHCPGTPSKSNTKNPTQINQKKTFVGG